LGALCRAKAGEAATRLATLTDANSIDSCKRMFRSPYFFM
jgi:hypothetical protein